MTLRTIRYALPFTALLALAACGGADEADDATAEVATDVADATDDAVAAAGDAAEAATDVARPLDVAAIDAVVAGVRKESELLTSVVERMREADSDMAKLALISEVQPARLEEAGAAAAGLDADAYRRLKDDLFTVIGKAEMRAMMEQQFATPDTTGMDEAAAAQAKQAAADMQAQIPDPYEGLDPATAEAIRARLAELTELRASHIGLLFKAAGG